MPGGKLILGMTVPSHGRLEKLTVPLSKCWRKTTLCSLCSSKMLQEQEETRMLHNMTRKRIYTSTGRTNKAKMIMMMTHALEIVSRGTVSPYPTVLNVTTTNHNAWNIVQLPWARSSCCNPHMLQKKVDIFFICCKLLMQRFGNDNRTV